MKKPIVSTRTLTVTGMLVALIAVMMLTGIGLIRIGPTVAFTLLCLPVIVGTLAEGLGVGVFLGAAFGVISFAQSFSSPELTAPYFMNPLVSVLPRMLIPVVTALVYKALSGYAEGAAAKRATAWGVSALYGSLTNTVLVLGAIYISNLVGSTVVNWPGPVHAILLGAVLTNGLPEAALMTIVTPPILAALGRSVYRGKGANK